MDKLRRLPGDVTTRNASWSWSSVAGIMATYWPVFALAVFGVCSALAQWFAYSAFGGISIMKIYKVSDSCEAYVWDFGFPDGIQKYFAHTSESPDKIYSMSLYLGERDFKDRLVYAADGQMLVTETEIPPRFVAGGAEKRGDTVWMYTHGLETASGRYLAPGDDWSTSPEARQSLHDALAASLSGHGGKDVYYDPIRDRKQAWREVGYWEWLSWQRRIARGSGEK